MSWGRDFARVLAVAAIAVGAVACGEAKPQVLDLVELNTVQRNLSGCENVAPSAAWIDRMAAIPGRVETVPESVEDVQVTLTGYVDRLSVRMSWKAENKFGGTSKREIWNTGKLDIAEDCSFSLKDGAGWSES